MPATDPAVQLARQLSELQREVRGLSRGSQMSHRSLENGSIPVYDATGGLRGTIGQLEDGTTGFKAVNGPVPPTPTAATLEPAVGGLIIGWDGTWVDADRPGDFLRVEAHASTESVYTPSSATRRATFTASGSALVVLPPNLYTVLLVTVSTSDVVSAPSRGATETPEPAPTYDEVVAANGKNKVFWRRDTEVPTSADDSLIDGDLWFQKDHDYKPSRWDAASSSWVDALIGDNAVAGLNVGKLTSGEIAAGERIIAGPQFGTHAELSDTGLRVFREDPVDGIPDEVIRLGTSSNDYFAIVGADGELRASIDDSGQGNFRSLSVTEDPMIMGAPFSEWVGDRPGGLVSSASVLLASQSSPVAPIVSEYGLVQHVFPTVAGRTYLVTVGGPSWLSGPDLSRDNAAIVRARYNTSGNATINNDEVWSSFTSGYPSNVINRGQMTFPFFAGVTGYCYMLITIESFGGNQISAFDQLRFSVADLGQTKLGTTTINAGGGKLYLATVSPPPPPATKQYYVDLPATSWGSYRGNNTRRTDVGSGVIQGMDPSGYNGDGHGFMGFSLPSITGTVDRVDLYTYTSHWYNNSGGTAIWNLIKSGDAANINALKMRGDTYVAGYAKPGGKTITLPSDWRPYFRNDGGGNPRAIGVSLGKAGSSNLGYYGRFEAQQTRLRVWYTQ